MYPLLCHKFVPRTGDKKKKKQTHQDLSALVLHGPPCKNKLYTMKLFWCVCMSERETEYAYMHCVRACMYDYMVVK